ncbi:sodium/hydrogen exchanger [groundwater metagenome]
MDLHRGISAGRGHRGNEFCHCYSHNIKAFDERGSKVILSLESVLTDALCVIAAMMPRGLAAAVLATMPLAAGIEIPYFAEIVFSIIILTNLVTTFGVFAVERRLITKARSISQG